MKFVKFALPCAALAILIASGTACAQGYSIAVKGQVILDPTIKDIPAAATAAVNKDQNHCLAKGPIANDELIIDPKTRGVKNVMVWLAPLNGAKMPIHPILAPVPKAGVEIDQPCCMFVPRITMMREGQILTVKNPAPVLHNARISGSEKGNGTINLAIPPNNVMVLGGAKALVAEKKPMLLQCDVHGWMGGRIGVFNHPYFALTKDDGTFEMPKAPAGKYKLFLQHEKVGWLHKQTGEKLSDGEDITIPLAATLDVGKINLKPE